MHIFLAFSIQLTSTSNHPDFAGAFRSTGISPHWLFCFLKGRSWVEDGRSLSHFYASTNFLLFQSHIFSLPCHSLSTTILLGSSHVILQVAFITNPSVNHILVRARNNFMNHLESFGFLHAPSDLEKGSQTQETCGSCIPK